LQGSAPSIHVIDRCRLNGLITTYGFGDGFLESVIIEFSKTLLLDEYWRQTFQLFRRIARPWLLSLVAFRASSCIALWEIRARGN